MAAATSFALVVAGLGASAPVAAASGIDPVLLDVVASTADGASAAVPSTLAVIPSAPDGPTVAVSLDRPRQRLHGVGAALTESSAKLLAELPAPERHAALAALFDPQRGGLSVLRLVIGASDFSLAHHSLADQAWPPSAPLSTFSIDRDRTWLVPVLSEILEIAPDLEIVASPWSAPGWMKDSGSYLYGSLLRSQEANYARYLVAFVEAYRKLGIDVDWLTVQNEPAAVQLTYPSMLMSAEQQVRLLRDHVGPVLAAARLPTRVLAWDHNWCDAQPPGGCVGSGSASFPREVLAAMDGAHPLAGTGFHCYGGDQAAANDAVHDAGPRLQIWHTECSGGTWQADPFIELATLLVTDRNHWSNATLLWNLALDPQHGPHLGGCGTCRGIVQVDPKAQGWTPELDLGLLATAARFAPAGSGVLETTSSSPDLLATGACSPAGRPSVLVANRAEAATAWIRFGALDVPVELAARSLTAIRAPEGTACALADWPVLAAPASTTTVATSKPTASTPAPSEAPAAVPVSAAPIFTG